MRQELTAWPWACTSVPAIPLGVVHKNFVHCYLPGQFGRRLGVLRGAICCRRYALHLAELAHGHLAGALGNVLRSDEYIPTAMLSLRYPCCSQLTIHIGWANMQVATRKFSL